MQSALQENKEFYQFLMDRFSANRIQQAKEIDSLGVSMERIAKHQCTARVLLSRGTLIWVTQVSLLMLYIRVSSVSYQNDNTESIARLAWFWQILRQHWLVQISWSRASQAVNGIPKIATNLAKCITPAKHKLQCSITHGNLILQQLFVTHFKVEVWD